jgi:hypothetical protein
MSKQFENEVGKKLIGGTKRKNKGTFPGTLPCVHLQHTKIVQKMPKMETGRQNGRRGTLPYLDKMERDLIQSAPA